MGGYLTFGEETNIIITGNLLHQNVYLSKTLIILVVAGCYFQISPLIAVMAEIPEHSVFKLHTKTNRKMKTRLFRTILFLFICVISYICMNKLALLEAITGSLCTMIVSVICPALFYNKLVLSKRKYVMIPTTTSVNDTSPIFVANGSIKVDQQKLYIDGKYSNFGLRIILYLY